MALRPMPPTRTRHLKRKSMVQRPSPALFNPGPNPDVGLGHGSGPSPGPCPDLPDPGSGLDPGPGHDPGPGEPLPEAVEAAAAVFKVSTRILNGLAADAADPDTSPEAQIDGTTPEPRPL